ncbi:MAG: hypothetical protein K2P49_08525 [Oscillospiraceae bacterium]|nr:hypothetical protein [Oscillospiraceae bacterium]
MNGKDNFYANPNGPHCNFVFLGEAGSGKSEIAINFAKLLTKFAVRPVHFFDLDMTKPLFRSRDAGAELERSGIIVHYQEQFMDAPTLVGGVVPLLRDENSFVVLDVGGDYIGARSIGGFAPQLNLPSTVVFYVINAYRPWSDTIEHIDGTLGKILGVSHVKLAQLVLVANPNNGLTTTLEEVIDGYRRTEELVSAYLPLSFACVREELGAEAAKALPVPVFPLRLALTYAWLDKQEN